MSSRFSGAGSIRRLLLGGVLTFLSTCWLPAASAASPHALWHFDPGAVASFSALARPGVHPVQFDTQSVAAWPAGESGELSLPDGRVYQIRAERSEEHPGGNRTWVGKFDDAGRTYVVVLTYGAAGVAGEIRTPDGPVLLTMDGNQAVLVDTAAAGWRLPEVIESDAMIQPPPRTAAAVAPVDLQRRLKAAPSPQTTIDVLIAYTPGMVTRAGSVAGALLRLDQLIATSNQAYIDSEVAITLRLVHAIQVGYQETDDNSAALSNLTAGSGVLAAPATTLRDRYGADLVALVRPFNYPAQVSCGVAWVGGYGSNGAGIGSQSYNGFAVVSDGGDVNGTGYFCQNATFPHELGHIMGAMHDRQTVTQGGTVALTTGAYPYSYGYVHNASWNAGQGQNACDAGSGSSCFGTIMSYLTKVSELKFSNPALSTCPTGLPCGTANDNVALTLNNTRAGVAGWRATKVPFVGVQAGATQSARVNAPFSLALKVTLRDATNQLVPGVTVNFSAPASGASANLSATSAVTDANGVAQVTAVANGTAGSYAVIATAASGLVSSPFTFNLTNQGSQASTLTVVVNGGGSVTGSGISCPGSCSSAPASGSTVTLTAVAGTGAVFTGWLGGGCTGISQCAVNIDASKSVSATFAPTGTLPARIDVDLNRQYDALTDGLVILRYLFGVTGSGLTGGALGAGASRTDPAAVLTFLNNIAPQLDVDGDGRADALTDGVMIVRYLFGLRGNSLIQGAVGAGARRNTAPLIESYMAGLLP